MLSATRSGPSVAGPVVLTRPIVAASLSSLTAGQKVPRGQHSTARPTMSQQVGCSSEKDTFHTDVNVLRVEAYALCGILSQ